LRRRPRTSPAAPPTIPPTIIAVTSSTSCHSRPRREIAYSPVSPREHERDRHPDRGQDEDELEGGERLLTF
jgi:hypothetical protein